MKAEFLAHANEEQEHADQIAERISQVGSLEDMIKEDLVAERIAIETYNDIIR